MFGTSCKHMTAAPMPLALISFPKFLKALKGRLHEFQEITLKLPMEFARLPSGPPQLRPRCRANSRPWFARTTESTPNICNPSMFQEIALSASSSAS